MAWQIEITASADKVFEKMDRSVVQRILKYLRTRVAVDPRAVGDPLKGDLSEFWRYRVGDHRVLCKLEEERITVVVVKVGHRREVYKER